MPDNISVVPLARSACQPFKLEVMVFNPEAGFKFEVSVERSCTKATETDLPKAVWKLVFDLFRKFENEMVKVVHVSYTAENEVQAKKIQATLNGVNSEQSAQLINNVHPAVKKAENMDGLSPEEVEKRKKRIKNAMSKTVNLAVVEV